MSKNRSQIADLLFKGPSVAAVTVLALWQLQAPAMADTEHEATQPCHLAQAADYPKAGERGKKTTEKEKKPEAKATKTRRRKPRVYHPKPKPRRKRERPVLQGYSTMPSF